MYHILVVAADHAARHVAVQELESWYVTVTSSCEEAARILERMEHQFTTMLCGDPLEAALLTSLAVKCGVSRIGFRTAQVTEVRDAPGYGRIAISAFPPTHSWNDMRFHLAL